MLRYRISLIGWVGLEIELPMHPEDLFREQVLEAVRGRIDEWNNSEGGEIIYLDIEDQDISSEDFQEVGLEES